MDRSFDILGMQLDRRYKMIRESMILQSLMAHADYAAWLKAFLNTSRFEPPSFVAFPVGGQAAAGNDTKLPRRFSFSFSADLEPRGYEWLWLKDLFRPRKWSDNFSHTYMTMPFVLEAKGIDPSTMDDIPIKLRFAPQGCGYLRQLTVLRNITDLVTQIQKEEAKSRTRRHPQYNPRIPAPPPIHLECIDLDLGAFTVYPSVLKAVEKLLGTPGVRFGSVTLPGRRFDGVVEEDQLRGAWATLVCMLCGYNDSGPATHEVIRRTSHVDQLVVPKVYATYAFCIVPLLTALKDARHLTAVRLDAGESRIARDWRFGGLMGYAFFTESSSVGTLDIGVLRFTNRGMSALVDVCRSVDPLATLSGIIRGGDFRSDIDGKVSRNSPISVKRGTILIPLWDPTQEMKTRAPWAGRILFDGPADSTITANFPGFGLCKVDRSSLPNKKRRMSRVAQSAVTASVSDSPKVSSGKATPPHRLRSLVLRLWPFTGDLIYLDVHEIIDQLSTLVSSSLESLSITSDAIDNCTMETVFSKLPNLKSLRVDDAQFESMKPFIDAYHTQNCQVSSLDLRDISIPQTAFHSFLDLLATDRTIIHTIQHLRFSNDDWETETSLGGPSTAKILENVLLTNNVLATLHVCCSTDDQDPHWANVLGFHEQTIPNGPHARHRASFVSVLKEKTATSSAHRSG